MRALWWVVIIALMGAPALAQRSEVLDRDAVITVTIENPQDAYVDGEMVLLTIHGIYRRHITREKLIQPNLNGFGWMQLGQDYWYDSTEKGQKVKNMRRRMAVFPNREGQIEIGAFRHRLTLLDEELKWFDHEIASAPIAINVGPARSDVDWWLPVHRLEVEDSWSNAPDQLADGEGVLRVIRVEAHGASPDMLPPMPELRSPTALIYPHPEKRLVELTPQGPVAIGFWRWTVRPTNGISTILEPLYVDYFDTLARESKRVEISAQRVAYGTLTGRTLPDGVRQGSMPVEMGLRTASRMQILLAFGVVLVGAGVVVMRTTAIAPVHQIWRRIGLDRDTRAMRRATRRDDPHAFRRAAHARATAAGLEPARSAVLAALDTDLFAKSGKSPNLRARMRQFKRELRAEPE